LGAPVPPLKVSIEVLRWITIIIVTLVFLGLIGAGAVLAGLWHFGRGLPEYQQLADYRPPVMTRVHAGDGSLITEYATEKRAFVPIRAIPKLVIKAFLAAEDKNFYSHPGIDPFGVARALVTNLRRLGGDRRPVGASTITQQVAKNFLLTNEVSYERKIKEAILALRIERTFSKNRILELYLNEIYLGFGAYGAAAAALNYFNKSMDELTVGEAAFIAALPKAPNNYHPIRRPKAAKARRDWVISRMLEESFITKAQAEAAMAEPLVVHERENALLTHAEYFAEEVRRELLQRYGDKELYRGGLSVRTTLEPKLQRIADRVLREGLIAYDRRHGWRGPIARLPGFGKAGSMPEDWAANLAKVEEPPGLGPWRLAVVFKADKEAAAIGLADGSKGAIPLAEMRWARPWVEGQKLGVWHGRADKVLNPGDVVAVEAVKEHTVNPAKKGEAPKTVTYPEGTFSLRQVPDVNGAVIALDPHTGRVLAMAGGIAYSKSQFNRATQAERQPGSAFKPFVYLAALDEGFTPSSLILDAPFVVDQGAGLGLWKPQNYGHKFYGPSTMRLGIEKSRNLMTVRLAQTIGMDKVAAAARRFGIHQNISENLSQNLALALGAGETTLLRLVSAYAMLVNGGKKISPSLIDRIQDRNGRTVLRHDKRPCEGCQVEDIASAVPPVIPDTRPQVADPLSAYQVVSMLHGVVRRGTGVRIRAVGKPLAGKTGTTNNSFDTWFIGFSPDLAVGVFVGFDKPKPLGDRETGSSVAAPIFRDFMAAALKDKPATPFRIPPGIRLVRVNAATGRLAAPGDTRVILEAFKPGTEPTSTGGVVRGIGVSQGGEAATTPRGLY